jgi:hypothetical protein
VKKKKQVKKLKDVTKKWDVINDPKIKLISAMEEPTAGIVYCYYEIKCKPYKMGVLS